MYSVSRIQTILNWIQIQLFILLQHWIRILVYEVISYQDIPCVGAGVVFSFGLRSYL